MNSEYLIYLVKVHSTAQGYLSKSWPFYAQKHFGVFLQAVKQFAKMHHAKRKLVFFFSGPQTTLKYEIVYNNQIMALSILHRSIDGHL